jgi:cytochrome c biogenesis protein CcmG/thiol:disulfide interchange protein DsbE
VSRTRWLVWGFVGVVAIVAIVVALTASGGDTAKPSSHETAAVTVDGDPLPRYSPAYDATGADPAVGMTIPTLRGTSVLTGKPVTIAPDGKPQAVVFVAHWCPHCQAEVPRLVALAKQGVFKGLEVSAVATGTNSGYPNYPPSAWLQSVQWPFPAMADSPDQIAAQAYGLDAYPFFVLVNKDGTVARRATGEIPVADIQANVKALVAGQPLPKPSSGASSSSG